MKELIYYASLKMVPIAYDSDSDDDNFSINIPWISSMKCLGRCVQYVQREKNSRFLLI